MGVAATQFSHRNRSYRIAFADLTQKVQRARALMAVPNPDQQAIDAALLELEKARVEYNRSRDVLAEQLLSASAPPELGAPSDSVADRVREVAELRWELAGKPEGTAEDDWYRAEEIVRRAEAA